MPEFATIDLETLDRMLKDHETVLVEVLPDDDYQEGHIPGAINIPWGRNFAEEFQQTVPEHGTPIIVYCAKTDGDASPKAATRLVQKGYRNVHHYAGGKEGWREAGRRLEKQVHEVQESL